jgi:N-acetylmuramoyl-L-alanine amidase
MKSCYTRTVSAWLCGITLSAHAAEPVIRIAFPAAGSTVATAQRTYVLGSVTPADTPLTVNGQTVTPSRTGGFLFMADVAPGTNTLRLRAGPTDLRHTFTVPFPPTPWDGTRIRVQQPQQPLGVYTGETVRLVCQAPAGRALSATVGERTVALAPSAGDPTLYAGSVVFHAPVEKVPVAFHAEGLAEVPASSLTARSAWPAHRVVGPLFETRARSQPGDGDTVAFLTPDLLIQGGGHVGAHTRFWLNGTLCFTDSRHLTAVPDAPLPPRDLPPPDLTAGFGPHPPRGRPPSQLLIVLDPGHGGTDTGALGPASNEKTANLLQALAIRDTLKMAGFRVLMTREKDVSLGLYERVRMAYEAKADAFISIHHNANAPQTDPRSARHVATYAWNEIGLGLARALHPRIAAVTPIADRGVMTASFAVCRNPAVPSCLLELDFINCPEGEESVLRPEQQRRVAGAVLAGLRDWLSPAPNPQPLASGS